MESLSNYFYRGPAIKNNKGRELFLQRIDQGLAYAHILEGIPYGQHYAGLINSRLRWACERYPNRKTIILEPRLRPLPLPEEDLAILKKLREVKDEPDDGLDEDSVAERSLDRLINGIYRNREVVSVGSVCCCALFESSPIDDQAGMLSELTIVWFQDGFALPIDPYVIEQIQAVDWTNEAVDVDL